MADNTRKQSYADEKLRFEYDITAHCNLNCAGCSHYSPIAEKEFVTAEKAERELTRLGELVSDRCDIIHIMGGEPLLNPELNGILAAARRAFPKTEMQIVTNGILLGAMPPVFWKSCHENNVNIFITAYPVKIQLSKIKAYSQAFRVSINYFRNGNVFSRYPLSRAGKEDAAASFAYCSMKNCHQLHDGKLFVCSLTGCVHHLNRAFGESFEIRRDDFIDIYDNITADDIFSFLQSPVPFCRYCSVDEWKKHEYKYAWEQSKRDISEWILSDEELK